MKFTLHKTWFLFFTVVGFLLLGGCEESSETTTSAALLPNSLGEHDEVLVIMSETLWKGETGKNLRSRLTQAYDVLPQDEPTFKVSHITFNNFIKLHKKYRNILIAGDLSDGSDQSKFTIGQCGEGVVNDNAKAYHISKKVFAKPQTIIHLLANDRQELDQLIDTKLDKVVEVLLGSELQKYHTSAFFGGKNAEITKRIKQKFSIELPIPSDWVVAKDEHEFLWLRKETHEVSHSLLITVKPQNKAFENEGINVRNEVGKRFIETEIEGAYIATDTVLPIISKFVSLGGHETYENRGLWGAVGDHMGGPFVHYYINDEENGRIIFIEGFVYAPGTTKKKAIRQIEAIIAGVKP